MSMCLTDLIPSFFMTGFVPVLLDTVAKVKKSSTHSGRYAAAAPAATIFKHSFREGGESTAQEQKAKLFRPHFLFCLLLHHLAPGAAGRLLAAAYESTDWLINPRT